MWLFLWALIGIVVPFVTNIILDLAQIFITLHSIFLDYNDITANWQGVRGLTLLVLRFQMRIFFKGPTWSLVRLVAILTITVSGKKIIIFSFKIFLILKIFILWWLITAKTAHVAFLRQQRDLPSYFSFNIYCLLGNLLCVI